MNITESFYADKEIINLKDSIGRVAATSVMAYPPGVPLLVPGEEISQELYEHIGFIRENGLEIVGLMGYNKDQIVVIK
jgi:lysine decarboxylase